jgi:Predicted oxidoreductases of the aldo/keto reductase family
MKYNILGRTGLNISAVTFGGMINREITLEDSKRFVAEAVDIGVNYIDVAPSYGNAEVMLSPALEPYRKNFYLACKSYEKSAEGMKRQLLNSLKVLKTDYFDVYQFHCIETLDAVDKIFGPDGAIETMLWAKREGLIRNIGFSTHDETSALKAMDMFDFDTVLFPMNWAMGINTGWGDRISERVKETGAGLLAMKTLVHRKWRAGERRDIFHKAWCKPIYEEPLGIAGMKYGLYKGADTLIPPGDYINYKFIVDHIDQCTDEPLTDAEWDLMRREAELVKNESIFG